MVTLGTSNSVTSALTCVKNEMYDTWFVIRDLAILVAMRVMSSVSAG